MNASVISRTNIWDLLKKNLSKSQLAGYCIANIIGLTVILAGLFFFCDSRPSSSTDDSFFSDDYIVISKKVKGVNLEPLSFSKEEINELENEPMIKSVGNFTPSRFPVEATVNMGGRGMTTQLFMEAVPDNFFDKLPEGWDFSPGDNYVPIVLNKDYLALYNFGFAIPQGLPQMSEDIISSVPLRLKLIDQMGKPEYFNASVVGFSSRLNTIAVPQQFIDWANDRFAPGEKSDPSRLIIKVDGLESKTIQSFMNEHGYEIAGDKDGESKISDFLAIVSGVIAIVGILISSLAIFVLVLSIFLLLQKSKGMIHNLLLLGYSPREVSAYYERMVIIINSCVTLIALGFAYLLRMLWIGPLKSLGLDNNNVLPVFGVALIYLLLIIILNIIIIRRHILMIWYNSGSNVK